MSLINTAISRSWLAVAGATLSIAIGCSSDPATMAGPTGPTPPAGAAGQQPAGTVPTAGAAPTGTGTAGAATPPTGIGAAGSRSGAAGTTGPSTSATAGTGTGTGEFGGTSGMPATPPAGGSGAAGMTAMPTAGTGTTTTPPTGGKCDTSSFMDCTTATANWGTPLQEGPCKTGKTIYGVMSDYGPYGARSKRNIGEMFNTGNTKASDFNGLLPCTTFIDSFGADPKGSADLKDTHDLDFGLYTVFYPGCMPEGEKFPLITWGNGTCAMPEGYGALLRMVASYGYIVVAPNSVQVGSGVHQKKGIDMMFAENKDSNSIFFGKVDEEKVGAMGHSQGGAATVAAASDARIKSVILFNGGTSASKPFLAVGGDRDIAGSLGSFKNSATAAPRPAAYLFYHQIPAAVDGSTTGQTAPGHLTLMMEPERVWTPTYKWFDLTLKNDPEAKKYFIGADCAICKGTELPSQWITGAEKGGPSHEYGANAMLK